MANFQLFLSVQKTGGSPTGSDPVNRVCDQHIRSPDKPVSSGSPVIGEQGHFRAGRRTPW